MAGVEDTVDESSIILLIETMETFEELCDRNVNVKTNTMMAKQCRSQLDDQIKAAKSSANCEWSHGKAFSVLSELKKNDELKRDGLRKIYKRVQEILGNCDEKLLKQLAAYFNFNLKKEIEKRIRNNIVKEYTILFAGEVSSGKSSLINLILGEDILPVGLEAVTSIVCEIRYAETRKLLIHKNVQNGGGIEEITLDKPSKEVKSYADQLKAYLSQKDNREKESPYEKCELYWPHELLKEGVVIVDSPGIGESKTMTAKVTKYLEKAFCFVYVINSPNAGGVQTDRIVRLFEAVQNLSPGSFNVESAMFVCNKWDSIEKDINDKDREEFKQYIESELQKYWPKLDSSSQVIQFSTHHAKRLQNHSCSSEKFVKLMNLLKSLVLRTITSRLENEWRMLDSILERTLYYTKAFIQNAEKKESADRFLMLLLMLKDIEGSHQKIIKEIGEKIEAAKKYAIQQYSDHFSTENTTQKFTTWSEKECTHANAEWENIKSEIKTRLKQRFYQVLQKYESEEMVLKTVQKSLMNDMKKHKSDLEIRIKVVEAKITDGKQYEENSKLGLTLGKKVAVGLSSPLWIPVAMVTAILGSLPFLGWTLWKFSRMTEEERSYYSNKQGYMERKSKAFLSSDEKEKMLEEFVNQQLEEVRKAYKSLKTEIELKIKANKFFLQAVKNETVTERKNIDYLKLINSDCSDVRGELSFFALKNLFQSNAVFESLECDTNSLLGQGAFADVYQGTIKTAERKTEKVAVKIPKAVLNKTNAEQLLFEQEMLRNLSNENIVRFYGKKLQEYRDGTRVLFIMELCKANLRTFQENHPDRIPAKQITTEVIKNMLEWGKDVASGLEHLHKLGIVHRDLKPENILVGLHDRLKITDVGISKSVTQITGTMAGTLIYMAPEVFKSEPYGAEVDIYALGLILWEMWYGERAFGELKTTSVREFIGKINEGYRPTLLKESCSPPMPDLANLMKECWNKEPESRLNASQCVSKLESLSGDITN